MRGDLHAHTDWTDGRLPLEQLVAEAEARGYEYILVSDHSRSATVAGGIGPDELRQQIKAICALQKTHRIRILAGSECDILADGRMDFPDDVLGELDVVVAAVHSRFKQPRAEMTARIVRALENPYVSILAHPTGRRIGERDPYDVDLEQVFTAAIEHETPYLLNFSTVPVDGFWSITVYNKDGYLVMNPQNIYVINDRTVKANADGSYQINFGGNLKAVNYMPIMEGWNYTVRLYQPRDEILSGKWIFPNPTIASIE